MNNQKKNAPSDPGKHEKPRTSKSTKRDAHGSNPGRGAGARDQAGQGHGGVEPRQEEGAEQRERLSRRPDRGADGSGSSSGGEE
jgi:hypothetical protein